MLEYLLNSFLWSLAGLVIGYLLGRSERRIRSIAERLDRDEREWHHDDDGGESDARDPKG